MNFAFLGKGFAISTLLFYVQFINADDSEIPTEVPVATGTIIQTTLHRYVFAYGIVEPEPATKNQPAASAKLATAVAGVISQIECEEGQLVKKGTPLFVLDTRVADAQIAKSKVAVEFARNNLARKQKLSINENISLKLYDDARQLLDTAQSDLQSAQTQRDLLTIKAPLTATVETIHFKVGEAVGQGSIVADLIDLQRLNIVLHVPSAEATALNTGQTVFIDSGQNDNHPREGVISYISSQIDLLTDTVLVRVAPVAKNCTEKTCWHPGQFVHARIVVETLNNRLVVPVESLVINGKSTLLAVVEGDKAQQREVTVGLRDGSFIEVSGEGLHQGMTIVTRGAYGLPSETRIRVIK